jgi:hypothetical protein
VHYRAPHHAVAVADRETPRWRNGIRPAASGAALAADEESAGDQLGLDVIPFDRLESKVLGAFG